MIRPQHVYWDLKDRPTNNNDRKAKLAGRPIARLKMIGFFELTSKQYVADHLRLDIGRSHLENLSPGKLQNVDGCIKLDAEMLTFQEIATKQQDRSNRFPNVAKLCDSKWQELQRKLESAKLSAGMRPWDVKKRSIMIELTHDAPDITPALQRLRLV